MDEPTWACALLCEKISRSKVGRKKYLAHWHIVPWSFPESGWYCTSLKHFLNRPLLPNNGGRGDVFFLVISEFRKAELVKDASAKSQFAWLWKLQPSVKTAPIFFNDPPYELNDVALPDLRWIVELSESLKGCFVSMIVQTQDTLKAFPDTSKTKDEQICRFT